MYVMFKLGGKIVTPSLASGSVLPGITRKTALQLLREWGYDVQERNISVDELIQAAEDGTLEEAWGTGTAAVVSPVGEIFYGGRNYTINRFEIGEVTHKLYETITGIQWGRIADPYGWTVRVC